MTTASIQSRSPRCLGPRSRAAQHGVSLIIVLMILLVITVLGVGGAQLTLQAERGSRNDRDIEIAHQAAEQALTDAELDIQKFRTSFFKRDNDSGFAPGCSNAVDSKGLCKQADAGVLPVWATAFDDDSKTVAYGTFTNQSHGYFGRGIQSAREPRYVIEATQDSDSCAADDSADMQTTTLQFTCKVLRITAMGYGPNEDTKVVLQTEFRYE
jgi:type IV pilus assembly protein PilX